MLSGHAVIVLLGLQGAWGQQEFSAEPEDVLVAPGSEARLECYVERKAGECRWSLEGKPVGMFEGKYELRGDKERGDCSITVSSVDLKIDDGAWQCQVTATNISSGDALVSRLARLTVQVPPAEIVLEAGELTIREGGLLTVTEDRVETVRCVTRYSNPAPTISWRLGESRLTSAVQTNRTEEEEETKWRSESVLSYTFSQSQLAAKLSCEVHHPAYETGMNSLRANLDVLYRPTVRIERENSSPLEAGRGSLTLHCISSSNPPGRTMWYRQGQTATPQYKDQLVFDPISREQAGDYVCAAENSVGRSEEEMTTVTVLYGPESLQTTPMTEEGAVLHNTTRLSCSASAVPAPSYQWLQEVPGTGEVRRRASSPTLEIMDVWYADQGTYRCVASNTIGGERREAQSDLITLDVSGPPQVTSQIDKAEGILGGQTEITVEFCSDPGPIRNTWQWEEVILPSGNTYQDGKYSAHMSKTQGRDDCYTSTMVIKNLASEDMRTFSMHVENVHGTDTVTINLDIKAGTGLESDDPVPMGAVVGVTLALLIIFVVLVVALLIAYKKEKMCFKVNTKKVAEELTENIYTNEAYKQYLNSDSRHDYVHQNTKNLSSMDLISSHDSLVSLGLQPGSYSVYQNQSGGLYSMPSNLPPHYTLSMDSSEPPILSRFPSSLSNSNTRSNFQIYTQLQIPSTSNFGSMKKKKKTSVIDGDMRKSVESDISSEERNIQAKDYVGTVHENEMEKDMVYVPDYISINNNKPVKV